MSWRKTWFFDRTLWHRLIQVFDRTLWRRLNHVADPT